LLARASVLITRPQPSADALANKIIEQGGKAIVFSTFTIEPLLNKDLLEQAIQQLASTHWAIFVSPNAVHQVLPIWQRYWPESLKNLCIGAVGKSTADALHTYSLDAICPTDQFSSESLLSLPELQSVQQKSVMIFQGETGRGHLQTVLTERGAKVSTIIAYRRVSASPVSLSVWQKWQQSAINTVVYTSAEGMLNLYKLVDVDHQNWLKRIPAIVPSARLAKIAQDIKITSIIQSKDARNSEILKSLLKIQRT
jgi:uroporphyrinogen-III synthase